MSDFWHNRKDVSYLICLIFGTFLPVFSFGIFAPTEIFFANHDDLNLVYSDIGNMFWMYGVIVTVMMAIVLFLLPRMLVKVILCIVWILSIAGYIQTMFLNGNMDRMGESTFGYQPTKEVIFKDSVAWIVVIVFGVVLIAIVKKNWTKLILFTSLVLIATQGIAYASLFQMAEEDAFTVTSEGQLVLDGSERFSVSTKGDVVVIVLDSAANFFYDEWMLAKYPEAEGILKDFTYYNNAESLDYGTFPSAIHLVTGYPFDPTSGVNQYFEEAWANTSTSGFFRSLHEKGYDVRIYEYADYTFMGSWGLEWLSQWIDNIKEDDTIRFVDHELTVKTLLAMSCYRFMPDYFKPKFDVPNTQYASLVSTPENVIEWANPDFYENLQSRGGLTVDDTKKHLTYYFLDGVHEIINDENCLRIEAVEANQETVSNAMRGCWTLIDEYLTDLKKVGAYDNSTIIVTADHGVPYNNQPIFFIKEPGKKQDAIQVTSAPITWNEIMPTIADCVGLNGHDYGETIYDYKDGDVRTRSVGVRSASEEYPLVDCFNGMKNVDHLIYQQYEYTGNRMDWRAVRESGEYKVIPAAEAFYW